MKNFLKYSSIVLLSLIGIYILFQFQFDASNEADKWMNELIIDSILLLTGVLLIIWLIFMRVKSVNIIALLITLVGFSSCQPYIKCPCVVVRTEKYISTNTQLTVLHSTVDRNAYLHLYTTTEYQIGDTIK